MASSSNRVLPGFGLSLGYTLGIGADGDIKAAKQ